MHAVNMLVSFQPVSLALAAHPRNCMLLAFSMLLATSTWLKLVVHGHTTLWTPHTTELRPTNTHTHSIKQETKGLAKGSNKQKYTKQRRINSLQISIIIYN